MTNATIKRLCGTLLLMVACGSDDETEKSADANHRASDAGRSDGNTNGVDASTPDALASADALPGPVPDAATSPDASEVLLWNFPDVNGLPNVDDDDANGVLDREQAPFAADNDFSELVISAALVASLGPSDTLQLQASQDEAFRVWLDDEQVLGGDAANTYSWHPTGETSLRIDFSEFNSDSELTIRWLSDGELVQQSTIHLRSAPAILNHHLQGSEKVWAMAVSQQGYSNAEMISGYEEALGDAFSKIPASPYDYDVWVQDEFEFATMISEDEKRIDLIIDSIRNRGLDNFPESLDLANSVVGSWGNAQKATTFDSFGNLEVSPPVTVIGTSYPHGRIYYGRQGNSGLNSVLASFLNEQEVQEPFQVNTTWLCVGHVDEITSFVPDPSSPKGFKLLISDVPSAIALLQSLPSSMSIPRYQDHGYATVGDILDDNSLIALNEDLQADYLDPILAQFKAELGLTNSDIIKVPSLFEHVSDCGPYVAAMIPGMVNLVVTKQPGQATKLFIPDPFFRSNVSSQSNDPFIEAFSAAMPNGLQLHFLNDWDVYHLALGEVHCGTNVQRTPAESWWPTSEGETP